MIYIIETDLDNNVTFKAFDSTEYAKEHYKLMYHCAVDSSVEWRDYSFEKLRLCDILEVAAEQLIKLEYYDNIDDLVPTKEEYLYYDTRLAEILRHIYTKFSNSFDDVNKYSESQAAFSRYYLNNRIDYFQDSSMLYVNEKEKHVS